jgi:uncharacterized membrane protein
VPVSSEEDEQQEEESAPEPKSNDLAFDFPGAITLAIGISSLLTIIDLRNQLSWEHPLVIGITIIGIFAILIFLAFETYPGNRELLIPLRLLKTEVGAFCAGQVGQVLLTFPHVVYSSKQAPGLLTLHFLCYFRIRILTFTPTTDTYCWQLPWSM